MPCMGSLVASSAVLEVAWPCWSQGGLLCKGPQGGLSGGDGGQSGRRARRPDPCLPPSVWGTENALECSGPDRALSTRGLLCRVALRSPPPPCRAHRSSGSPESRCPPAFPRKGTHGRTHHPLPSRVVTPGQCGETDCFCRS